MNIEEIRKHAPKGATHYVMDDEFQIWFKELDGDLYSLHLGKWIKLYPFVRKFHKDRIKPL